ncbi:MAG: hypothetical protein MR673_08685 [Fusobacterium perfoetens]|uniref:hypothetical protein n=1 Tax=Fusobacterium perfoetens TaxID=852 RepID=UPI0023F3EFE5|nr:hypothetical protein [Fusobacterium perfoetens]MCI6153184.1 hypothetical protein [Fusobacterium perfoetens]MDY3237114.1 hypothetical protein [Fusobacterium perfoetens]
MKILIKNKKWNIFLGNTTTLECDVIQREGLFYIQFEYDKKLFKIKSRNIDNTLKYLEDMFVGIELRKELNNRIAI